MFKDRAEEAKVIKIGKCQGTGTDKYKKELKLLDGVDKVDYKKDKGDK